MIDFKIKGGKEVAAMLQQLPVQIEKKILRNALSAGVRVLRDEARAQAPAKSGALRKAIRTSRDTRDGRVIAKVRLRGRHAYLGVFMEYGVAPHLIAAGGEKRSLKIDGKFVGKAIEHPGISGKAFMAPAMEIRGADAVRAATDYITRYLQFGTISAPTIAVDDEE